MHGIVKRKVPEKSFGFIADASGAEYFFHRSEVIDGRYDELQEGDPVDFDPAEGQKGPRARQISRSRQSSR